MEYKNISLTGESFKNYSEDLGAFFSSYPKKDLDYELKEGGLIVKIRQIDFINFRENIEKEITRHDNRFSEILKEVYEGIDSIKSYGLKGKKRLYVGYNKERKVQNRKEKEKKRGRYYYASDNKFSTHNNSLPEKYLNQIIQGNSEHILKELPDNSIDLIFTSPPYNFGLDYDNHADGTDWNDYLEKLFAIFKECVRVLKYGGRIIVNVQPLFSDYIPLHHIVSNFFMQQKLIWKGEVVWDKHNWNCKYTAWGSWKSPSNPYLKYTWEFLEIFCKGELKKTGMRENIDITADEFKKLVIAKWDIAPEKKMKDYGHPAMFPENLVKSALKLFSYKEDIILDPFNGVGTTCVVAKKLGRKYLGIETSEKYCDTATKRLASTHEALSLF